MIAHDSMSAHCAAKTSVAGFAGKRSSSDAAGDAPQASTVAAAASDAAPMRARSPHELLSRVARTFTPALNQPPVSQSSCAKPSGLSAELQYGHDTPSHFRAPFAKERGTGVAPSAHRKAVTLRGWRVRKRPTLESRVTLLSPRCSHPLAGHDAVPAISKADSHGGLSNVWMIMTMPWRTVCRTLMPCVEPCLRVVWKRDTASLGDGEDTERSTERALRRSCVAANRWRRVPASMQQSVVRMTTWTHRARLLSPWLGFWHTWSSSLTPPSEQTHPQNSRFTPRCLSVVLWTPCSGVGWGVFEPSIRVWRSGTKSKQPANLAVEGAEEFLSILPDHAATVRPPPKRC
jgi:hypothetical protein